ncbi:NAD(P)H-hydrate dehydratase [Ostreiculturibacter nitratireducens]|uniref:NAD(P)H-hydrate dehydratase n=1 Tax=Ostreiculturibacter nitratireducens TaxID=3075226 RepID=UPI0031B5A6B9
MTELLTAAQMRAVEQAAIASGEVTGLELMERAGRGIAEAIFAEWPELAKAPHRAVVLCGPGNNGGDGFVVARLLAGWGWKVEVFLFGDPATLPPDARTNHDRWREMGEVRPLSALGNELGRSDLALDAFFGTGLARGLPRELDELVAHYDCRRRVAVDGPSGLCLDSGRELSPAFPADLTVTFHSRKIGHALGDGPRRCGKVVLADIGISRWSGTPAAGEPASPRVRLTMVSGSSLSKNIAGHKYGHGHALILSGGPGKGGAARLAARGALRIGAGLVTVGCPPAALQENAAQLNAVMLKPLKDADALDDALRDSRLNALCLGPGMGMGQREAALVSAALGAGRPTVLDADALSLLAGDENLFRALHPACVLTPHSGEFARLFPDIAERLAVPAKTGPALSKVDATREAAKRGGCTVLFKGPDTVIADPSGAASINSAHYDRSAPWLATAGSGDVLAGFIAGLLARGFPPMRAAETAAWLHVECALSFGPGLIAEDIPEELPKVFRALGL